MKDKQLVDVDWTNKHQLVAEGAGALVGVSILTNSDSGTGMKLAAAGVGFVAGNAAYNVLFGPGSVVDGVEHPWDSAKQVITNPKHATIGQDLATAGLAYGGMQAGKLAYKGGKNLYGRVVQGGSNAAEESEVGVEAGEAVEGAEVAGGAVEGAASAGFFGSIGSWFSGAAAEVGTVVAEEPILAAVALAPIGL
jgi:hypothetical protein